jgi:hypothetical protein
VYANPDDLEELQFITLRRYARARPRLLRSIASAVVMRPHRIGQRARFIGTLSLACRRGARYRAFPISKHGFSALSLTTGCGLKHGAKGGQRSLGGDGGIRTLDRALQPYNGLANRRLQPLGHVSRRNTRGDICPTHPLIASAWRSRLRRWAHTLKILGASGLRGLGQDQMAAAAAPR